MFLLLALAVALVVPGGGWVLFAFFRLILLFWLVTILARIAFGLMYRRRHHYREDGRRPGLAGESGDARRHR
jgi:hypothetical protein